jgi:hypothetical protein
MTDERRLLLEVARWVLEKENGGPEEPTTSPWAHEISKLIDAIRRQG